VRVVGVAVDGLAADHERGLVEGAAAGDADVEESGRALTCRGERGRGPRRRLDRADTADERGRPVGAAELVGGRGNDEDHARTVPRCAPRAFKRRRIGRPGGPAEGGSS
jgi:hypothetical protein